MDTANTEKVGSDKVPEGRELRDRERMDTANTEKVGSDKVPEGRELRDRERMDTANTEKVGTDKVPEGTPNTENVVPKAVPKVGAGKGAAGQNAASICNYVPFYSEDFYEAVQNLGRTTTIDDCWSIFTGLNSETGSPLSYEEFERMVRRGR